MTSTFRVPSRVIPRFHGYVDRSEPECCWPWMRSVGSHGYGQVGWHVGGKRVMFLAHRVAWALAHGPIPEGLTIDHKCRNRRCCNPAHLRLLTRAANSADNGQARRTHCPKGHPYDAVNTYRRPRSGHRVCRACNNSRSATL